MFRHEAPAGAGPPEISGGDAELIEAIDRHLETCFGADDRWVFHEIVSPTIHLDVHVVPPTDAFPVLRLVTSGMAERPMTVPADSELPRFAELTVALPADWPLAQGDESLSDERVYWPIRLIKDLARLPHDYSTFLWFTHTIPNGDPPEPYSTATGLCCALIVPPVVAPEQFAGLDCGERQVRILGVLPLYEDEMQFKLEHGVDALFDRLDDGGVADVIDPARPSVLARKKRRFFGR